MSGYLAGPEACLLSMLDVHREVMVIFLDLQWVWRFFASLTARAGWEMLLLPYIHIAAFINTLLGLQELSQDVNNFGLVLLDT